MTRMITQETQRASYIDLALLVAWDLLKRSACIASSNADGPSSISSAGLSSCSEVPPGQKLISHTYASDCKEDMEIYDRELCQSRWDFA